MWQKTIKKTLFALNIDNYCPEITDISYPLMQRYADKIGADFYIISERKFPDFPVVYEKMQIYELGQQMGNDWNIYVDSDALIHPDTPDFTELLNKNTVLHHGADFAPIRWKYDRYFRRDNRNFGSCNWFTMASDLCIDLWKPLDDLSLEEAISNIHPISDELLMGVTPEHLIDDYTLSRNIAKYGLRASTVVRMMKEMNIPGEYFWHEYLMLQGEKIKEIARVADFWKKNEMERNAIIAQEKKLTNA